MPHYDYRNGRFVEIPAQLCDDKRIAREQGLSRGLTAGFNIGLAFGELFGHPFDVSEEEETITLATLYNRTTVHGELTGVDNSFRCATFGSVIIFASGIPRREAIIDLSMHEIGNPNNLLGLTYKPSAVCVDNGEVFTLPAGIDDTVKTAVHLAKLATEFLAPIKGFYSMPKVDEVA